MKYTNKHNLPLELAVMLATDEYEYSSDPRLISVTSILKSVREIVLTSRISPSEQSVDVIDLIPSVMGTALHNQLEKAWLNPKLNEVLLSLGIPRKVVDRIRVNPEEHDPDMINIYLEKRTNKTFNGWTISGKFDLVVDGKPKDLKSTSTFKWNQESEEYRLQMSIYKWLNPEIIADESGNILFWFKDWNKNYALGGKGYPNLPLKEKPFALLSEEQVENYLAQKLNLLDMHWHDVEEDLPQCTPKELWQSDPVYKYYAKPDAVKASNVFSNHAEANAHLMSKGKGHITKVDSEPTKCKYCTAINSCSQARDYLANGTLKL